MVFSSVTFLFFFLPIFLLLYFLMPSIGLKNAVTLACSLLFYAWGEPFFVLLLVGSIAFSAWAGVAIDRRAGAARRWVLAAAVTANLALLAVFKYAGFVVENLAWVLAPVGLALPRPELALPLGISFFTFHALSYLIDIYRRRFPANRNPVEVALYISLFPQLVAGPIVRYKTVARQLRRRRHTLGRASAGARMAVIGLAQKVLIADQLAPLAETVFDRIPHPSLIEAWAGLLAYTLQIYFDFAGYSTMAIGLGLVLGFTLPRNFALPYTAGSVTEFWRRWHISLSSWLRDYLYIPLGGSRGGAAATYRNLVTVFLVCGLWHGAGWTFLLWGAWHGAFLVLERAGLGRVLARMPVALGWAYTMAVVMGAWVLFRATDLDRAATIYGALLGSGQRHGLSFTAHLALGPIATLALIAGCLAAILPRWLKPGGTDTAAAVADTGLVFGLLALALLVVAAGTYSPFLYFRF
jgi:D-alanyl-lipoteichoic acid acyltransferase DltB (MBOAT superfamily)